MPSRCTFLAVATASLAIGFGFAAPARAVTLPPPIGEKTASGHGLETAMLAGGCFWGVEGVFQHVRGVRSVVSGYAGGKAETAHYETVSTGTTGHAEAVKITFDPAQTSYGRLLQVFLEQDGIELNVIAQPCRRPLNCAVAGAQTSRRDAHPLPPGKGARLFLSTLPDQIHENVRVDLGVSNYPPLRRAHK